MEKHVLLRERVRTPPREGFSWVDRRFMREYASQLEGDGVLLYLFLAAVSDKQGLSYYGEEGIESRTGLGPLAQRRAREELLRLDLIAYEPPLYQVLSLPERGRCRSEPMRLGDLFAQLAVAKGGEA